MTTLTFPIPRPLWISANRSAKNYGHLASVRRKIHVIAQTIATALRTVPIDGPVSVTWTIHYPKGVSWVHGDPANAHGITKALMDGLVDAGILPGDGPRIVTSETFQRGPNLVTRDEPHQIHIEIMEGTK